MKKQIYLIILLLSCSCKQKETNLYDEYMQKAVANLNFSGNVLIAKDGKIIYEKSFGYANYEWKVPNTEQSVFRIASITKQFTAALVLKLQEKRLLNVNDKVSKYLPDYPKGDSITIHQLLTYTSGIPDYSNGHPPAEHAGIIADDTTIVNTFKNLPFNFTPGSKWEYSNSGYALLGYICHTVTGKNYDSLLNEIIFSPLGMNQSGYDYDTKVIPNHASGYSLNDTVLIHPMFINMTWSFAAGGLYSTARDLFRWNNALNEDSFLTVNSKSLMFKPWIKANVFTHTYYGYGFFIDSIAGHFCIWHDGTNDDFKSAIFRLPDDNACIIVLSNQATANSTRIAASLVDIMFNAPYQQPEKQIALKLSENDLKKFECEFDYYNGHMKIYVQNDSLFRIRNNDTNTIFELAPQSQNLLSYQGFDSQIEFVRNTNGRIEKIILWNDGQQSATINHVDIARKER